MPCSYHTLLRLPALLNLWERLASNVFMRTLMRNGRWLAAALLALLCVGLPAYRAMSQDTKTTKDAQPPKKGSKDDDETKKKTDDDDPKKSTTADDKELKKLKDDVA